VTGRRAATVWLGVAVTVTAAGVFAWQARARASGAATSDDPLVPTAHVLRGTIDLSVYALGELRASKSVTLPAPSVGGTLRLLTLADVGASVKAGDVLMEFDPTEQHYALEQAESQQAQAEQQAIKTHADMDVQASQDTLDLLTAQFDLRRAELDATPDQKLIPAITFQKNQLALDDAKHHLAQVQTDAASRKAARAAAIGIADEAVRRSKLLASRAKTNIDNLVVKSTIDGMVALRDNFDAAGGMMFSGMSVPPYRAGDNVSAGRPIMDVFDLTAMEIRIRINEQERDNVAVGQAAMVEFDSLPGVPLPAKVTTISGLASQNYDTGGPLRQFDSSLQLEHPDGRLRPGASVHVVLTGRRLPGVLNLPRQALFQKDGKPVVYVKIGDHFEAREVKVTQRTESRAAIEGVSEGTIVALVDPEAAKSTTAKSAAAIAPGGPAPGGSK
jgi:HlyD family secretion protein